MGLANLCIISWLQHQRPFKGKNGYIPDLVPLSCCLQSFTFMRISELETRTFNHGDMDFFTYLLYICKDFTSSKSLYNSCTLLGTLHFWLQDLHFLALQRILAPTIQAWPKIFRTTKHTWYPHAHHPHYLVTACICFQLIFYLHTHIQTDIHTYWQTYIHTYWQTDRQTDIHTKIHIHTHMHIHRYIHTYIHT